MGNQNTTTTTTTEEVIKKPSAKTVRKKPRVPGSVHANDQSAVRTPANLGTTLPTKYNSVTTGQQSSSTENKDSSIPILLRKPATSVPTVEQSSSTGNKDRSTSVLLEKPAPSALIVQQSSSVIPSSNMPNNVSSPHVAASITFEKAPMIQSNYIAKTSDNKSINIYTLGTMNVMHRTSSQSLIPGNRWYDHDYNKNLKPPVIK